jgi:hypothetical protein
MDPNAAWRELASAIECDDWGHAAEIADGLLAWLARAGFPPKVTGHVEFDRIVVQAACWRIATWDCA